VNAVKALDHDRLRILIVNYEHPPIGGGGGVSTQTLAKELVRKGHSVHILTTWMKGFPRESDEEGVRIFRVPVLFRTDLKTATNISMLSFPITSIIKGLWLCRKFKYDIINTHFYAPSGPTGMVLSILTRIPNVLYVHGADVYDPTRMNKTPAGKGVLSFLLRQSARLQTVFARSLACQSSDTRRNIERYVAAGKTVRVIPLPFQKPAHPAASRAALGMKPKLFYLLSAGRVVKRKGYDYLIRAMRMLDERIHLIIIGEGPELAPLSALSKELGLEKRVRLLGYVEREEDKYRYYRACDMFVLSSVHEGMGIVVQEAMEFGMPVVAPNHGGQVDLIRDGKNGTLVPPSDPGALAAAIDALYRNKRKRELYGRENARLIRNYYVERIAGEFLDWYRGALKRG